VLVRDTQTPKADTGVTRSSGHAPFLGWSYAPRTSPTVGPVGGALPYFRVTPVSSTPAREDLGDVGANSSNGKLMAPEILLH